MEELSSMLTSGCGQPISGAAFSMEHQTVEGSSAAFRRRDTIRPLKFLTSGGVAGPYYAFVKHKINEESDGTDEELGKSEWEVWMQDLDRQDKVERFRQAEEANCRQQQVATATMPLPAPNVIQARDGPWFTALLMLLESHPGV
jgi:hypothetical protein